MTITDGSNRPDYAADIADQLPRDYAHLSPEVDGYEIQAIALPEIITDKESHDRTADLIATLKTVGNKIETLRVGEKDPYLRAERAVDGFFNPLRDRLVDPKKGWATRLNDRVTVYLRAKAERERAEARERARVEEEKAAAIRRRQAEEEARAAEARRAATRETREAEARRLAAAAQEAENRAAVLRDEAAAKPSVLARERTDKGSLSGLKSEWTFEVENYAAIDLNLLRPYIKTEIIDKALKDFAKNNKNRVPVTGVRFFETENAQIRRGA